MTKEELLKEFGEHLKKCNHKNSTKSLYLRHARSLLESLTAQASYQIINHKEVAQYINQVPSRRKNLTPFTSFLKERGIVNLDRFHNQGREEFPELIDAYLENLHLKNRKQETINSAASNLALFAGFLKERKIYTIQQVSKKVLNSFVPYLQMKKSKAGTGYDIGYQVQVIYRVKEFFSYLLESNRILHNPSLLITIPKLPKRVYRDILTIEEIDLITNQIDKRTLWGKRDMTIIETLYASGVRVGELSRLKVEDISFDDETLFVRLGKGSKDRVVPINSYCKKLLQEYLATRKSIITKTGSSIGINKGILFINIYGQKMSKDGITRMIKVYARKAGITKKATAHIIRHSVATHLLANGASIRHIQTFLGHDSLSSTQKYTRIIVEDLKNTLNRYHPLEVCDG